MGLQHVLKYFADLGPESLVLQLITQVDFRWRNGNTNIQREELSQHSGLDPYQPQSVSTVPS